MIDLNSLVLEYPLLEGAIKSGIATLETLVGGPPSVDLSYVMPGAKSAVVFSIAMDQTSIPDYLAKKDRLSYEREYNKVNSISSGIAVPTPGASMSAVGTPVFTARGNGPPGLRGGSLFRKKMPPFLIC